MYHLLQFWCWFGEELIVKLVFILAHMDHKGTTTSYLHSQKYKYLLDSSPYISTTEDATDIITPLYYKLCYYDLYRSD